MLATLPSTGDAAEPKINVFVMTDDPVWVSQHTTSHPDLRIFSIGGKGQPEQPGQQKATADAIDLFASLMLSTRCGGMVGNFDSNISSLMFEFMCYYREKCPAFFSFGGQKAWRALGRRR